MTAQNPLRPPLEKWAMRVLYRHVPDTSNFFTVCGKPIRFVHQGDGIPKEFEITSTITGVSTGADEDREVGTYNYSLTLSIVPQIVAQYPMFTVVAFTYVRDWNGEERGWIPIVTTGGLHLAQRPEHRGTLVIPNRTE